MLLSPLGALAADVTRVASSFEEGHPFGLFLDVAYERTQHNGVITRETHQGGERVEVPELNYLNVDSRMDVSVHIGLWRSLELSVGLPIVFSQTDEYQYARGRDASNSTLLNNCVGANGELLGDTCLSDGTGAQSIGNVPSINHRSGLGNVRFGLAYGILKQEYDPSKPTWIIYLNYEAPTASRRDPAGGLAGNARTGVGDRVHRYTFGTALSRRLGVADPYMKFDYTLPFRGPGFYSNCDRTDLGNLAAPENCSHGSWSRAETGINAPHVFSLAFGTEILALDNPARGQKIAFDVRGLASYHTAGRYYNEVSALFGKLMSSDGYVDVGGSVGFTAQPASFITFRLRGSYRYQTDRTLTAESLGKDIDGDGRVSYQGHPPSAELNPTFDYRTDLVGRRLRIVDNGVWALNVSVSLNF